jgi:hypothetical protein
VFDHLLSLVSVGPLADDVLYPHDVPDLALLFTGLDQQGPQLTQSCKGFCL